MLESILWPLNLCNYRCQQLLVPNQLLDHRVVDLIPFKGQILLLSLLYLMLQLDQLVLHQFHVRIHLHLLIFESWVLFHTRFHFCLQFPVLVLNCPPIESLRIITNVSEFHDSLFEDPVLNFEILHLVWIQNQRFHLILQSSQFGLDELVSFMFQLKLSAFLFEFSDKFVFSGNVFLYHTLVNRRGLVIFCVDLEVLFQNGFLPSEICRLFLCNHQFLLVSFNNFKQVLYFLGLSVAFCRIVESLSLRALSSGDSWLFYLLLKLFKLCIRIGCSFV